MMSVTFVHALCDSVFDLVFVLPGSNSLAREDFHAITNFVASEIQDLPVSEDQIQVGVVVFASSVGDTISITGNEPQLLADLAKLQQTDKTDSGTGTHLAIERALRLLQNSRPNIPDAIVIIITDGATDEPTATNDQVQIAVGRGVLIFAIGIGWSISMEDLISLAAGRTDRSPQ
nr:hypothetical protein BaRGS_003542 [Batillaria attramentaria]